MAAKRDWRAISRSRETEYNLKFRDESEMEQNSVSRKGAKTPSSESSENILNFAPWRLPVLWQTGLGEIEFLEVVLSNL
jgi:hypothetical protein